MTQPPGKPPPARSGAATRKQTASYASLTMGRTKEDMLTNPAFSSSINTPESARKYLVDHFLLAMNQDPVHPSLSTALLHLTFTASGVTAPAADAIRAIAILLDSLTPLPASSETITPQQLSSLESLKSQLSHFGTYVEALREVAAVNTSAASAIT
ncbi:hypothetical protein SCLCIDRAFT_26223 [Scleroderma citrinum Foug A]|uniref:Uncharacterized protein n=1 Tax=Scleroderma citrinum Foug A TaxID=1036808 RepID=A0A0C3D6F9_9AGAM|nr:hypothetical protein SCLCIDRAFT_33295 [Scleroderma citrinum Foug A]KIM61086.1 hypothetical protein SCLCIDRAFT_26223 [Scleroderma citrinum Foug A]